MRYNVAELEGAMLDAAVAKAEGTYRIELFDVTAAPWPDYSVDWSHSGPIIERERIRTGFDDEDQYWFAWIARDGVEHEQCSSRSLLIAAMRAYVASKLGPEIELP